MLEVIERLGGTHFLQLRGQPHDYQTHVADDGEQHLAQALGLARLESLLRSPIRGKTEFAQLAQVARQASSLGAEALIGRFSIHEFCIEQRLQHGGDDHVVVGIERAHDLCDIQGRA